MATPEPSSVTTGRSLPAVASAFASFPDAAAALRRYWAGGQRSPECQNQVVAERFRALLCVQLPRMSGAALLRDIARHRRARGRRGARSHAVAEGRRGAGCTGHAARRELTRAICVIMAELCQDAGTYGANGRTER
jgi:hypothetical protein